MIGLGGAEFRLPLLIGVFGFPRSPRSFSTRALSPGVVLAALPARLTAVSVSRTCPMSGSKYSSKWRRYDAVVLTLTSVLASIHSA